MKKISAAVLLTAFMLGMTACNSIKITPPEKHDPSSETSAVGTTYETETTEPEKTTAEVPTVPVTVPETTAAQYIPATEEQTTSSPLPEPETKPSYQNYTIAQIIAEYQAAWQKTRNIKDPLSIHHSESFEANVLEASPGGQLTTQLINYVVGLVVKPSDETLKFVNGRAVNSESETVPILLPQKTDFSLSENAVASATIKEENGLLHTVISLKEEKVGLNETPVNNANAIGFLDTGSLKFNVVKINSCDITYTGSTIDAYIDADGYIKKATYTINILTKAQVSGLGIDGSGTLQGKQTEVWEII